MTLLIFDCDGTLVDSELLHAQAEVDLIKEKFGLVVSAIEHNRRFCGCTDSDVSQWIKEKTGKEISTDFYPELTKRKNILFSDRLQAMPHIHGLLRQLTDVPKCVASNTNLNTLTLSLQKTGLYNWFAPNIFSAQMVAHGKPAPDLFLYAAQQMRVTPQDCIVIEDSQHGVNAALAAKMRVFSFAGGSHCDAAYKDKLSKAELVFDDMRELPHLLKLNQE